MFCIPNVTLLYQIQARARYLLQENHALGLAEPTSYQAVEVDSTRNTLAGIIASIPPRLVRTGFDEARHQLSSLHAAQRYRRW